jgi:hypothetical protein
MAQRRSPSWWLDRDQYESGKQVVSVPMSNLLRLLARDPSRLREIAPAPLRPRKEDVTRAA